MVPQDPHLNPPFPFCWVPAARVKGVRLEQDGGALAGAAPAAGLAPEPPSLGPDFQRFCLLSWS